MPTFETFFVAESDYATLANETHCTRHPSRLDLAFGRKRQGNERYAAEELTELGSAFLSADPGVTPEPRKDHAAYIASFDQSP
jgi:antirestriction protein ArdC